jgi:hypothetical protein
MKRTFKVLVSSRRRRTRGAAFVESIIVISMISLMLAGGLFFHRLYMHKFRVMSESRTAAWQGALNGCPTGLGIMAVGQAIWNSVNNLADCNPLDPGCMVDGLSSSSTAPTPWVGETGANVPPEVTYTVRNDSMLGGAEFTVKGHYRVVCNETPQSETGDLASLVDYIRDSIWPED